MRRRRAASADAAAHDGLGESDIGESFVPEARGSLRSGREQVARSGREQVAELQRARMLTAMVQEVAERGVANVSVGNVVGRSGVSRRTFYEIFDDREDCFLAAFDEALNDATAIVAPAYLVAGKWRVKIRAALTSLLEFLESDPAAARLLIVESLAAGPKAQERRRRVLARIIPVVEEGSMESKTNLDPSGLTAEGVVGGVLSVLHARLVKTGGDPLETGVGGPLETGAGYPLVTGAGGLLELTGSLMGMIVLPYLGPAAARKEIEAPPPKLTRRQSVVRVDPLQELPMRFTYRTMRVLASIAELDEQGAHPSNRAVGRQAGIGDQGQTSKLLARLHKLGLIENKGGDPARGEPNAWTLTEIGAQVHDSIAGLEQRAS